MCKHLFMCWPWSTLKHFNCPDSHTAWRCLSACVCLWLGGSKRKLRCSVTQTNALRVDVGQRLQMTPGKRASPAASLHGPPSPSPSHSLPLLVCQVVLPIQISNLSGICNCIFAPSGIRNNLLALICQAKQTALQAACGPCGESYPRACSCCCIFTVIENGIKCFANTARRGRG